MPLFDRLFGNFWPNQKQNSILINELETKISDIKFDKIENQRKRLLRYLKDEEKVDILIKLWHELSPKQYEYFIAYIFNKILGYTTFVTWWLDDWWIDIKWAKKCVNWELEYIAIQCKRWNVFNVKQKDIKEFYWSVADIKYKHKAKIFFATTNYLTQNARKYTDEHDIYFLDYDVMIQAYKIINWSDFIDYLSKNTNEIIKTKDNSFKRIIWQKTNTVIDLYSLLKEVRANIAKENKIPAYFIFKDSILEEIARIKPQNKHQFLWINWVWEIKYKMYWEIFISKIKSTLTY